MKIISFIIVFVILCLSCRSSYARVWTDTKGRQFKGEYIEAFYEMVVIKRTADNKIFEVDLNNLIEDDRLYVIEKSMTISYDEAIELASKRNLNILCFYANGCEKETLDKVFSQYRSHEDFDKIIKKWLVIIVHEQLKLKDMFIANFAPNPSIVFIDSTGSDFASLHQINKVDQIDFFMESILKTKNKTL